MYKYLFETLLSVLLGIYPEVELLVLLRSSAVLLLPEQLTRELLAKVEPVQMPWRVWFSVLYQLMAVSAPTSHTLGLGFLLHRMEATAGRAGEPSSDPASGPPGNHGFAAAGAVERSRASLRAGRACGGGATHTRHTLLPAWPAGCSACSEHPASPGPRHPRTAPVRGDTDPETLHRAGPELGQGPEIRVLKRMLSALTPRQQRTLTGTGQPTPPGPSALQSTVLIPWDLGTPPGSANDTWLARIQLRFNLEQGAQNILLTGLSLLSALRPAFFFLNFKYEESINPLDLTERLQHHPTAAEDTFFSSARGTFPRLGHKTNLNPLKRIKIILSMFSQPHGMKLEIQNRETWQTEKPVEMK